VLQSRHARLCLNGSHLVLLAGLTALVGATPAAWSDTALDSEGVSSAQVSQVNLVDSFVRGRTQRPSLVVLDFLVREGISVLEEAGEYAIAKQALGEWQSGFLQSSSVGLSSGVSAPPAESFPELEDFAPLSQWLSDFYTTLNGKTKGVLRAVRVVQNINEMNYALPVVLSPRGKWKCGDYETDRIEYRKHFIPFANIASYWLSFEGCKDACVHLAPNLQGVCQPVADKLEFYMGRYLAPKAADWIFSKANGHGSGNGFMDEMAPELPVMSLADLESSLQTDGIEIGGLK